MSQLEISLIGTDGATQSRACLNLKLIDEYAQAITSGAQFPPVTVFYDGTNYWLADGFHRLLAAKNLGFSTISVDIQQGTCRDAVLYSLGANATHGLRRSNADKRRCVLTILSDSEWSQWSNNEIAKVCCVAEGLVRKLKEEVSSYYTKIGKIDLASYARKCGVDEDTLKKVQLQILAQPQQRIAQRSGTNYKISTANIGRQNKSEVLTSKETATSVLTEPTDQTLVGADHASVPSEYFAAGDEAEFLWTGKSQLKQVAAKSKLELSDVPTQPLNESVRIISIKQQSQKQVEKLVQTFEVNFLNVRVEIEGRPDTLVMLFEQMQHNPTFAEEVLRLASVHRKHLDKSH